jgi:hypothetical protein
LIIAAPFVHFGTAHRVVLVRGRGEGPGSNGPLAGRAAPALADGIWHVTPGTTATIFVYTAAGPPNPASLAITGPG